MLVAHLHRHRRARPGHRRRRRPRSWPASSRCAPSPRQRAASTRSRSTAGDHSAEEHALLAEHIVAYRLDGPLFFAAAHRFLLELSEVADVRVVILRMSRVTTIDATGALVLGRGPQLNRRGIVVLLSGIRPAQRQVLDSVGLLELLRAEGHEYAHHPRGDPGSARSPGDRRPVLSAVPAPRAAATGVVEEASP